jgi:hypothetical protein
LRALFYLVFSPFLLVAFLAKLVIGAVIFVLSSIGSLTWALIQFAYSVVTGGVQASGMAARWSAKKAMPVGGWLYEQSKPLFAKLGKWLSIAGRHVRVGAIYFVRWIASAKNDVLGEGDREVNPISLVAKLVIFVLVCIAVIVLVIEFIRGILSIWTFITSIGKP